jgi:hypothetical protein
VRKVPTVRRSCHHQLLRRLVRRCAPLPFKCLTLFFFFFDVCAARCIHVYMCVRLCVQVAHAVQNAADARCRRADDRVRHLFVVRPQVAKRRQQLRSPSTSTTNFISFELRVLLRMQLSFRTARNRSLLLLLLALPLRGDQARAGCTCTCGSCNCIRRPGSAAK